MFEHYPTLYLRTKDNVDLSTTTYPLAFATPYEDNAAGRKRINTVDTWAQNIVYDHVAKRYVEPEAQFGPWKIDNKPMSGFKFDKDVKRWSTSNKWFNIRDPRGFTLQISSDNLTDLIHNGELRNGEIIGEYLWGRFKGQNYLVRVDNILFKKEKRHTGIQVGDVVEISTGKYTYFGTFYVSYIKYDSRKKYIKSQNKWVHDTYVYEYHYEYVHEPNKVHIFGFDRGDTGWALSMYKSLPRYNIVGKTENLDLKWLQIDEHRVQAQGPLNTFEFRISVDKEELAKYTPTAEDVLKRISYTNYLKDYTTYYNGNLIYEKK